MDSDRQRKLSGSSSVGDCDLEPALEFDDSEFRTPGSPQGTDEPSLATDNLSIGETGGDLNMPDEMASRDEDYETALQPDDDFDDLAQYGIVEVAGVDLSGRTVIVVSACRLPPSDVISHAKLLRYLQHTLDQFVETDYVLVYFHHGLNSKNKPTLSWLWTAFRTFDRKYKKNLKNMYLVHPTTFIKVIYQLFKPYISTKFGRKIVYVNRLSELKTHLRHFDQIQIPEAVAEHDAQVKEREGKSWFRIPTSASMSSISGSARGYKETQQFGVPLEILCPRSPNGIPPVLKTCIQYLTCETALESEGLFRRSANGTTLKAVQSLFDEGKIVELSQFSDSYHLAAATLKSFLRNLPEPLLTFSNYGDVITFQEQETSRKGLRAQQILQRLPQDNLNVLLLVFNFLAKVVQQSDFNKMSPSNLAIVFGPSLLWSERSAATLNSIQRINHFVEFLIKVGVATLVENFS
ncbi:rho GTPase-activating protein 1-like isoform X1 [Varroa jacobsoni]|uniref:Rho GTPase-activating protein 1 n=2 Tax=Varroa destructor TaxID=109461 RepID=A0A7M7KKJ9_VARDE|nr:rho GTPase-activating protein 1-like isoform X1 [Varroa destructor]XP_022706055.1 rho GTPase-activating protein 1-like isoform X1 [Varroa jacobsoni]